MPTFRMTPSSSLTEAVRRMVASGRAGLSPLDEMQADQAAAETAHKMSLVEKMRADVERDNAAQRLRSEPAARTEYAAHSAGINLPEATQLARHIRGEMDANPQGPADAADNEYGDVPVRAPELAPGQEKLFRTSLASTMANLLATGKTNAEQLAAAGGHLQKQDLVAQAANAPDVETGNRLVAAIAGKLREPHAVGADGQVINRESGVVNEDTRLARAAAELSGARTATEGARQRELTERGGRGGVARETALERNLRHLVAIGAAPDEKSALALLRASSGKSEKETVLGLAKILMQTPGYYGKDGAARAMADAAVLLRSDGEPAKPSGYKTAEEVRAAHKAGKIDRATAIRELANFGYDPE